MGKCSNQNKEQKTESSTNKSLTFPDFEIKKDKDPTKKCDLPKNKKKLVGKEKKRKKNWTKIKEQRKNINHGNLQWKEVNLKQRAENATTHGEAGMSCWSWSSTVLFLHTWHVCFMQALGLTSTPRTRPSDKPTCMPAQVPLLGWWIACQRHQGCLTQNYLLKQ